MRLPHVRLAGEGEEGRAREEGVSFIHQSKTPLSRQEPGKSKSKWKEKNDREREREGWDE
jgi:hypothetical protein